MAKIDCKIQSAVPLQIFQIKDFGTHTSAEELFVHSKTLAA
jgi:hypothetical protein